MKVNVATVGDNCIDRFLPPIGLSTVGGNAVNVAVQLARLGCQAAYFGAVGQDPDGDRIVAAIAESGVSWRYLLRRPGRTAVTELAVDAHGDRRIVFEDFGVCQDYAPDDAALAALAQMRHVHIGWLSGAASLRARLAELGVGLSQDAAVTRGFENLDIAFCSAGENREEALALAHAALQGGAKLAVVTCGALGSIAWDGHALAETGIAPVRLVDTTGAGDTFIAGFICARVGGAGLQRCLEAGRDAAAATCTHFGGFPQRPLPLLPVAPRQAAT